MPASARCARASCTQSPTTAASFRHGKTMLTSQVVWLSQVTSTCRDTLTSAVCDGVDTSAKYTYAAEQRLEANPSHRNQEQFCGQAIPLIVVHDGHKTGKREQDDVGNAQ